MTTEKKFKNNKKNYKAKPPENRNSGQIRKNLEDTQKRKSQISRKILLQREIRRKLRRRKQKQRNLP